MVTTLASHTTWLRRRHWIYNWQPQILRPNNHKVAKTAISLKYILDVLYPRVTVIYLPSLTNLQPSGWQLKYVRYITLDDQTTQYWSDRSGLYSWISIAAAAIFNNERKVMTAIFLSCQALEVWPAVLTAVKGLLVCVVLVAPRDSLGWM